MIFGIGTDIVQVKRLQNSMERQPAMASTLFTPKEREYCEIRASKWQSYAARFAAKEAFMKALGTGWTEGVHWKHIEILRSGDDAPRLVLSDSTKELAHKLGAGAIHISISHEQDYATACVVIEKINS
ncbi:MAG: holo-ACP synthase [Candidatus Cloacimonetes bacterium]|nr:holo-ACP synthase [Candidatus Cloacimonadota bacterium]